jgi:hypothetical protein
MPRKRRVADRIARRYGMLAAIDFHDESGFSTKEINDIGA